MNRNEDPGVKRSEGLNERFDRFSKENRLAQVFLPLLLYFAFFLLFELTFAELYTYITYEELNIYALDRISYTAMLGMSCLLFVFPKSLQRTGFIISAVFWLVYGFAQLVVYNTSSTLARFANIFTGKDAAHYAGSAIAAMPAAVFLCFGVLIAIAAVFTVLLFKKAEFPKGKRFLTVTKAVCGAAAAGCLLLALTAGPDMEELESTSYIYKHFLDNNSIYSMLDIYTYTVQDVREMVMAKSYAEKDLETVRGYLDSKPEHTDNDMTGIFKGKNLLVIQLESFNTDLIADGHCPKIKEIYDRSIVFDNYYGMRFGIEPTIGNEMAVNLGLYANTVTSASKGLEGYEFPYSLPKLFAGEGYSVGVYHFNDPKFYDRLSNEPVFGYDSYTQLKDIAADPEAFFEDDYLFAADDGVYSSAAAAEGPYMHYFVSYSAHTPYELIVGQPDTESGRKRLAVVRERHPEYTIDESDPDSIYRAYALLTDDMVGELIERMEADGSINDTVILFVSDHACQKTLNDTASSRPDHLNVMKIPCFIYTGGIEPRKVEKTCSNIDLLPTLLNLFGIECSNKFIGNDIFDENAEGLAYLPTLDWVTDKCKYCQGSILENYTGGEIPQEYIDRINSEVSARVNANNCILFTDYYAKYDNG